MSTICFYARYEDSSGDGCNDLTVTWDVDRVTRTTGATSALITGAASNVALVRRGLYGYRLTGADLTLYDYVATAITASATPTVHEVAALWTYWSEGAAVAGDAMTLANDAITSAKFDETTAFPLKAADSGSTYILRTGADSDTGETLSDQIDAVATLGSGASANTYTVTDGTNPLDGVAVWVTTDLAGSNVVANGTSNSSGQVTFMLDAGTTYYIWRQLSGYNFTNPDTEVAV